LANEVGDDVWGCNGVITGAVLVVCVGTDVTVVGAVVVGCTQSFENHAFMTLVSFSSVLVTLTGSDVNAVVVLVVGVVIAVATVDSTLS